MQRSRISGIFFYYPIHGSVIMGVQEKRNNMKNRKRFLIICNIVAAVCFVIAGIGNLLHGKAWLGIAFVICAVLQCISAIANYRNPNI